MARSATIEPILPQPIMPSVLPKISTPRNLFFSHFPARVEASASGICRASDSISVIACSAVVIELPNGVFITIMPRAVADGMSTLSTPMPARPITLRLFAFSRIFGVTLVAERIANPSKPLINSASLSLSLPRLGWKSTSIPRSLKIATAAGESASEIRTLGAMVSASGNVGNGKANPSHRGESKTPLRRLGERVLGLDVSPVEPQRERLDVGPFDGRAAPDAQARRRVAIGIDVVSDAFLVERRRDALNEGGLCVGRQPADVRIDDFQADRRVRAQRRIGRQKIDPVGARHPIGDGLGIGGGARLQRLEAADRFRPFEGVEIILDAKHRRRIDGFADKDAFDQLAAFGHAEDLRHRPSRLVTFEAGNGAR